MLIDLKTLCEELPALRGREVADVRDLLAGLGFPVDATEAVGDSWVLEVDITANRGDVQSLRGMARDIGARLDKELAPVGVTPLSEGAALRPIRLEAVACSHYATAVLDLPAGAGTPAEAKAFLARMGAGAKDLAAVDASNVLLHRYGHPTHAFDAETLQGEVSVRWAREGETLVTLDGVVRTLGGEDLVIADETGPVALAGVMGGEATKVTESTRTVLLESAWFNPRTVRAMARRHVLHTDASHRFGRGADPAMAVVARDLLVQRLQDWAGAALRVAWTVGDPRLSKTPIALTREVMQRIAGEDILLADAAAILRRLGCTVEGTPGTLKVLPPSWRHDLAIPEDLAEEVLRLRGYDRIPAVLPPMQGEPMPLSPEVRLRQRVCRRLAQTGFHQCVTLGFVAPDMDASVADPGNPPEGRTLVNPLGREYSVMRSSLLPSLLEVAARNFAQGAREVRLFEVAPVYRSTPRGPVEEPALALVWGGSRGGEDPLSPAVPLELEGQLRLQGVLRDLGVSTAVLARRPGLWPGLGESEALSRAWCVEVPLSAISLGEDRVIPTFAPFSRFPAMERDLSLLVDLDLGYDRLAEVVCAALADVKVLRDVRCVDVFRHKSLPEGRQAWLIRLKFQADDRTLRGEEVDGWIQSALGAALALGAELRG